MALVAKHPSRHWLPGLAAEACRMPSLPLAASVQQRNIRHANMPCVVAQSCIYLTDMCCFINQVQPVPCIHHSSKIGEVEMTPLVNSELQAHAARQPYLKLAAIQLEHLQILPALEIGRQGWQRVEAADKGVGCWHAYSSILMLTKHAISADSAARLHEQDGNVPTDAGTIPNERDGS